MSFQDEVRHTIQKARADREKYHKENQEFESRWLQLRDSTIAHLFQQAAKAFREENIGTDRQNFNGSTVLRAAYNEHNDNYRHSLTFQAEVKSRKIKCSSTLLEDEWFTLDHLTSSVIEAKIKTFADLVARGDAPRPDAIP